jgi:hypothetical protein
MTRKERLQFGLMEDQDCVYIRSHVSDDDWDDALHLALQALDQDPLLDNHRDFRERWWVMMKRAGIPEGKALSLTLMARAIFARAKKCQK